MTVRTDGALTSDFFRYAISPKTTKVHGRLADASDAKP
jgi:hypothetical protein